MTTKQFNFGDDPDHRPDPGVRSSKSAFTGLSKKLPTDFDEILRRPTDYVLVTIRITIRIREGRTATLLTLCDPIWQLTSRSCEMGVPLTAIHCFTFFLHRTYSLQKSFSNSIMLAFGGGLCCLSTSIVIVFSGCRSC